MSRVGTENRRKAHGYGARTDVDGRLSDSEVEDGLAFASVTDWASLEDLSGVVGPTPQTMALRPGEALGSSQDYPELWPFGPVFADR